MEGEMCNQIDWDIQDDLKLEYSNQKTGEVLLVTDLEETVEGIKATKGLLEYENKCTVNVEFAGNIKW